jgi:hypothetical protein
MQTTKSYEATYRPEVVPAGCVRFLLGILYGVEFHLNFADIKKELVKFVLRQPATFICPCAAILKTEMQKC